MNTRHIFALAIFLTGIAAAKPGYATPITYDLSGVTFADGGTASGSFTFDSSTDTYLSWSLTTTATAPGLAYVDSFYPLNGMTYTGINLVGNYMAPYGEIFHAGNDSLDLVFAGPLTDAGGTIAFSSVSETQNSGFESRVVRNTGSVSAVPLPASLPLFATAIVVLAFIGSKKLDTSKST